MLNSKSFRSVVLGLENNNDVFIAALDKVIKFFIGIIKTTEELREEIDGYNDLYQVLISDINFNFWFKVSNGMIIYKKGINRAASIKITYLKDTFIKTLTREMDGTDAYMKGKIKVDGDLTQGLRFAKLIRLFIRYVNNGQNKVKDSIL